MALINTGPAQNGTIPKETVGKHLVSGPSVLNSSLVFSHLSLSSAYTTALLIGILWLSVHACGTRCQRIYQSAIVLNSSNGR